MADFQVQWTETARVDLERIVQFIAHENPTGALAVLEQVERRCQTLAVYPERGRIVPELRRVDVLMYRELLEGPWRIVYRYDAEHVYVTAVLDARRDLAGTLLERLIR